MRLRAAVRYTLGHRVGLVPNNILPQVPSIRAQRKRNHPRDADQVFRFNSNHFMCSGRTIILQPIIWPRLGTRARRRHPELPPAGFRPDGEIDGGLGNGVWTPYSDPFQLFNQLHNIFTKIAIKAMIGTILINVRDGELTDLYSMSL